MNKKKIVIIGGGISGLSSGIYALKNGYDAVIYEKNHNAGGLCVSWKRKGFTLDGCIHWLTGTNDNSFLYKLWKDVGGFKDEDLIIPTNWGHFDYEGTRITLWADINRLEKELIEISPIDTKQIKKFVKMVKAVGNTPMPLNRPLEQQNLKLIKVAFRMIPFLYPYSYTMNFSCEQYAKKFKSKAIQNMIINAQPGPGNLFSMIYSYATIVNKNGSIPKGGSQTLTNNMLNKFLELGGAIHYSEPVTKIVREKDKAIGVRTTKTEFVPCDYVICALDPHFVFNKLIDGKYFGSYFKRRYRDIEKYKSPSCFMSYFAIPMEYINKYFNDGSYSFKCRPFKIADRVIDNINVRSFSYDPSFIYEGKCVVEVLSDQYNEDYYFWDVLYHDKLNYKKTKEKISLEIASRIAEQYPDLKDQIIYLDSFSPATLNYEVGAYQGSYMSFILTNKVPLSIHDGHIRHHKNVILSGQWTQNPGGLPLALATGRFAIQRILKKDKVKTFKF